MESKIYKILLLFLNIMLLTILFKIGTVNAAALSIEVVSGDCNKLDIGDEAKIKVIPNKSYEKINSKTTVTSGNNSIASVEEKGEYYIIKAKKAGNTVIKADTKYYTRNGLSAEETTSLNVVVIDKVKNEEKEVTDKIKDAEKTANDIKNAYKTIPGINANASEIDTFIKSDAAYNELKNLKTVDKETAKKWRDTLNAARIDAISRKMYTETIYTLEDYINNKDSSGHINNLTEQIEGAVKSTEKTADEYRKILAKLNPTASILRQNVTFVDVLNNIDNYVPGDTVTGSDAQKITEKASLILTVITNVGIVLAILMSAILGIKYMIGSVEEKAEYKKDLLPYFIGSILLFGICTIVKVLQTLGESINNI